MKIKRSQIVEIVREELTGKRSVNEELTPQDFDVIRKLIRREVALILFDLFKKRSTWV